MKGFPLAFRLLTGAGVFVLSSGLPLALAQPSLPPGVDQTPTRVLQIEQVLGAVNVQRGGRTEELRAGFLVFNKERMLLSSRSRAKLSLSRSGQLDVAASGDGAGVLTFEKLPFSSWAADLETRLKLERGLLRLRWARNGSASDWPLSVAIDSWLARLGNGEFLFRRDERGTLICSVAGRIELSDENAGARQELKPGTCTQVKPGERAQNAVLAATDWSELDVAILPTDSDESLAGVSALSTADAASSSKSARISVDSPAQAPVQEAKSIITGTAPAVATIPGPAGSVVVAGIAPPPVVDGNVTLPAVSAPAVPLTPPAVIAQAAPVAPRLATSAAAPAAPALPSPAAPAASPPAPGVISHAMPALAPARANETAPSPPPVSMRPMAQADIPAVVPPAQPNTAPAAKTVANAALATMPATAGAPTEGAGPEWIVNVMTLTDPDVARQHLATLNEAGYPAALRTEMVRGRSSFRIIIGGISSEQGARRTAQLLASKMGYTAAWPLQKR